MLISQRVLLMRLFGAVPLRLWTAADSDITIYMCAFAIVLSDGEASRPVNRHVTRADARAIEHVIGNPATEVDCKLIFNLWRG